LIWFGLVFYWGVFGITSTLGTSLVTRKTCVFQLMLQAILLKEKLLGALEV